MDYFYCDNRQTRGQSQKQKLILKYVFVWRLCEYKFYLLITLLAITQLFFLRHIPHYGYTSYFAVDFTYIHETNTKTLRLRAIMCGSHKVLFRSGFEPRSPYKKYHKYKKSRSPSTRKH